MNQKNKEFIQQVENFVDLCDQGILTVPKCMEMYSEVYRFINSEPKKWCEAEMILKTVCLNKFTCMRNRDRIDQKIAMISHAFAYLERVKIGENIPIQKTLQSLYEQVVNKE